MRYYLYRHIRLDTNEVFYVGIGKKRNKKFTKWTSEYQRAYAKNRRSKFWRNIINKTKYEVDILFEADSKEEIYKKEIEFIRLYGRRCKNQGTLVNITKGGSGSNEYKFNKETKNKMSKSYNKDLHLKHVSKKCIHIKSGKIFKSLKEGCKIYNENYGKQKAAIQNKRTSAEFMYVGEEFTPVVRRKSNAKECIHLETGKKFTSLRQGCLYFNIKYSQQQDALKLDLSTKKFKYLNEV